MLSLSHEKTDSLGILCEQLDFIDCNMLALVNKLVETVEADIACFSSVLNLIVKVLVIWAILDILFAALKMSLAQM